MRKGLVLLDIGRHLRSAVSRLILGGSLILIAWGRNLRRWRHRGLWIVLVRILWKLVVAGIQLSLVGIGRRQVRWPRGGRKEDRGRIGLGRLGLSRRDGRFYPGFCGLIGLSVEGEADQFATEMSHELGIDVVAGKSLEATVSAGDVCVTCTPAREFFL